MSEEVELRRATEADIGTYLALDKKVGSRLYSTFTTEKEVREEMARGPVYIAKKGNEVVGMISYEIRPDRSAYLSGFVVDPKYQGQGIGRAILTKVLAEIKDAPVIDLVTHPDNLKAINLYESLGFNITDRKENYFGDGEPRIVLTFVK